jgi:hypothetical protein
MDKVRIDLNVLSAHFCKWNHTSRLVRFCGQDGFNSYDYSSMMQDMPGSQGNPYWYFVMDKQAPPYAFTPEARDQIESSYQQCKWIPESHRQEVRLQMYGRKVVVNISDDEKSSTISAEKSNECCSIFRCCNRGRNHNSLVSFTDFSAETHQIIRMPLEPLQFTENKMHHTLRDLDEVQRSQERLKRHYSHHSRENSRNQWFWQYTDTNDQLLKSNNNIPATIWIPFAMEDSHEINREWNMFNLQTFKWLGRTFDLQTADGSNLTINLKKLNFKMEMSKHSMFVESL